MEKKVNFFIFCYPKAGTTTLNNYLKIHPEIYFPEFKETKFFATDLLDESDKYLGIEAYGLIRTIAEYYKLYKGVSKDIKIFGDASPQYIYSKLAARNIYEFNPETQIIIVICEPIAFLQSFHFESLARMNEDENDFVNALALEKSRRKGMNIPPMVRFPSYLYYSQWVDYKTGILRYASVFNKNQKKIFIFDDIVEDEQKVVQSVLKFLRLDPSNYQFPESINKNPSHTVRFRSMWKNIKKPMFFRIVKGILPSFHYGKMNHIVYKFFMRN